jgi:hypothetical protein
MLGLSISLARILYISFLNTSFSQTKKYIKIVCILQEVVRKFNIKTYVNNGNI